MRPHLEPRKGFLKRRHTRDVVVMMVCEQDALNWQVHPSEGLRQTLLLLRVGRGWVDDGQGVVTHNVGVCVGCWRQRRCADGYHRNAVGNGLHLQHADHEPQREQGGVGCDHALCDGLDEGDVALA